MWTCFILLWVSTGHMEPKISHLEFRLGGLGLLSLWPGSYQMDWLPGASHEVHKETESTECSMWRDTAGLELSVTHD